MTALAVFIVIVIAFVLSPWLKLMYQSAREKRVKLLFLSVSVMSYVCFVLYTANWLLSKYI